jgi:hypothetical protein
MKCERIRLSTIYGPRARPLPCGKRFSENRTRLMYMWIFCGSIWRINPMAKSIEVTSWDQVDFSDIKMPIITIYQDPLDYPQKYVARLFNLTDPTNVVMLGDNYEELVRRKPLAMVSFNRSPDDDPKIVETWI